MCGIVGLIKNNQAIYDIIDALIAIQHRGQDAAGAITYDGERFHLKKGKSLVSDVFNEKNINRLTGNVGLGHVRYPTIGEGSGEDAQPFYLNSPYGIAMIHNGNVANYNQLKQELYKSKNHINTSCDLEIILTIFAESLRSQGKSNSEAVFTAAKEVMTRVKGSYSVIGYIANIGMFAFKDPHGIKPLCYGKKDNNIIFASESVVCDVLDYQTIREVKPGEVIWVPEITRDIISSTVLEKSYRPCIFEWVYFARPDSIISGKSVYQARYQMGCEIAREIKHKIDHADVVIPVPDTARTAALAIAESMDIPYKEGLIKNRYIGRTFIMPEVKTRDYSMKHKLNPIISEISGKNVVLVDDSIVRGLTSRKIIKLVRSAGAKKIIFISTSPPIRHPCVYGIDMQTSQELIAYKKSVEMIRKFIGADQLFYLSIEGLIRSIQLKDASLKFCDACFTSSYPGGITKEEIKLIEQFRSREKISLSQVSSSPLFTEE
ncbi:MAG: amidophosphoribosyltransferase [bacterium]